MKNIFKLKTLFICFITLAILSSCNKDNRQKDKEAEEKSKVGKVYDTDEQGIQHENRDNQFPSSRNDNKTGTGLETGAPSDTVKTNKR